VSSKADLVLRNFYWKIAATTPTTYTGARPAFRAVDPDDLDPERSSGLTRGFAVMWIGSGREHEVEEAPITNGVDRVATHRYLVEVYYSAKYKWLDAQAIALQDRDAITAALRTNTSLTGYNADNPSADLTATHRIREGDELITPAEGGGVWRLRMTWVVPIYEDES